MTPTRIVRLAVIAAVAGGGCAKPPRNPAKGITQPTAAAASAPSRVPPAASADPRDTARAFAADFLKAVTDGTASPAQLTPQFKKVIAEPVFTDDQARGYSDDRAERWLLEVGKGLTFTPDGQTGGGDAFAVRGTVSGNGKAGSFGLRVVRANGGWLADWFFPAVGVTAEPAPATAGDVAFPLFAARAFLDGLLGKDDRVAEGAMALDFKKRLAPPFGSDKLGYNRGTLGGKLADLRGTFTGYRVTKVEGDAVHGELTKGMAKRPFVLKVVKGDRPWDWLVADVTAE